MARNIFLEPLFAFLALKGVPDVEAAHYLCNKGEKLEEWDKLFEDALYPQSTTEVVTGHGGDRHTHTVKNQLPLFAEMHPDLYPLSTIIDRLCERSGVAKNALYPPDKCNSYTTYAEYWNAIKDTVFSSAEKNDSTTSKNRFAQEFDEKHPNAHSALRAPYVAIRALGYRTFDEFVKANYAMQFHTNLTANQLLFIGVYFELMLKGEISSNDAKDIVLLHTNILITHGVGLKTADLIVAMPRGHGGRLRKLVKRYEEVLKTGASRTDNSGPEPVRPSSFHDKMSIHKKKFPKCPPHLRAIMAFHAHINNDADMPLEIIVEWVKGKGHTLVSERSIRELCQGFARPATLAAIKAYYTHMSDCIISDSGLRNELAQAVAPR